MHVNGRPVAAFDPEGLIFAAGVDSEMVKLYDLRSFDKVEYLDWILASFKKLEKTSFLSCFLGRVYANICSVILISRSQD